MANRHELTADGAVIVRGAASGFAQDIEMRAHRLAAFAADEPTSVGGTDRGPTPYDGDGHREAA